MMIKEYDGVQSVRDLSQKVKKGCKGTVVMVYQDPRLAYEVEFFGETGVTIELLTVESEDIILSRLYQ